eukprot:2967706-Prymnesium_polylepis.1
MRMSCTLSEWSRVYHLAFARASIGFQMASRRKKCSRSLSRQDGVFLFSIAPAMLLSTAKRASSFPWARRPCPAAWCPSRGRSWR